MLQGEQGGSDAGEGLEGYSAEDSADVDSTTGADDSDDSDSAEEGNDGSRGDEAGDSDQASGPRSLADLAAAIEAGDTDSLTDEESKRLRIAAARKLKTDAEIDAWIAKSRGNRPKDEAPAAKPKKAKAQAEESSEESDGEDSEAEDGGEDSTLAELFPEVKDPKERVTQVKELKSTVEKVNEVLQSVGYDSIEDVLKSEEDIGNALSTVDGLKRMYKIWGIKPPVNLEGAVAKKSGKAPANVSTEDGGEEEGDFDLDAIQEEEFIQGRDLKKLVTTLTKQIRAELDQEYKPLKEEVNSITKKAAEESERMQREGKRRQAYKDADFVSKEWGEYFPEYRLKDSAEKVWNESVTTFRDRDGKQKVVLKKERHPEFSKLEKILDFREDAFKKGLSVDAYVGRQFMDKKLFTKLVQERATKAKVDTLTNQRKRLQPAMVNRGAASPSDNFRVPESDADIANMDARQVTELHRRIARGEVTIRK